MIPHCGILVVKDPPGVLSLVPGILGMNVISRCYQELLGAHGPSLVDLPLVSQAPGLVIEALQQCHQSAIQVLRKPAGTVWVRGPWVWRIPAGVMKVVSGVCL